MTFAADDSRRRWLRTRLLTIAALAVWFAVTFVVAFFARDLSGAVLGWPLGFWVAAQGAPLVYLALVGLYARHMRQLDEANGLHEDA